MVYTGDLRKMRVEHKHPIHYYLALSKEEIFVNDLINHEIGIKYDGIIHCVVCGRKIKKAFGQGFCYPCFMNSPENSECIIKPELCLAHIGKGRDPEWEEKNHNMPHLVYLAQTSGIKVGVTRQNQIPTRWIDQGAWKAIKVALTPYRQIAGIIEVELKNHMIDKTPWQKMLKNETDEAMNIAETKLKVMHLLSPEFDKYLLNNENEILTFEYPVTQYPDTVKSLNLDKTPYIKGRLTGIRGQYLIFNDQHVINLRKYSGYEITLSV